MLSGCPSPQQHKWTMGFIYVCKYVQPQNVQKHHASKIAQVTSNDLHCNSVIVWHTYLKWDCKLQKHTSNKTQTLALHPCDNVMIQTLCSWQCYYRYLSMCCRGSICWYPLPHPPHHMALQTEMQMHGTPHSHSISYIYRIHIIHSTANSNQHEWVMHKCKLVAQFYNILHSGKYMMHRHV